MRTIVPILAAAAALLGCDAPSGSSHTIGASQRQAAPPKAARVTSFSEIKGRWAIARFRDFEPGWRHNIPWRGAYVNVTDDGLSYSIGCNHGGNRAFIDGAGVLHARGDYPRTLMGCSVDAPVNDHEFFGFFRTRPVVTKIAGARVRMAAGGTELVLEAAETQRRANAPTPAELQGRWVPHYVDIFKGSEMSGTSMENPRGVLTISRGTINWSECPEATVAVAYTRDFRLEPRSRAKENCDLDRGLGKEGAERLVAIMRSSPAVERTGRDSIVLFTDVGAVHLQKENSILDPAPAPAEAKSGDAARL